MASKIKQQRSKTYLYIFLFQSTWALLLQAHDESFLDHLQLANRFDNLVETTIKLDVSSLKVKPIDY